MNLAGSASAPRKFMKEQVKKMVTSLQTKALNHYTLKFLINSVFIPAILYRTYDNAIDLPFINSLFSPIWTALKHKLGLPRTYKADFLFQKDGYAIHKPTAIILASHMDMVSQLLSIEHLCGNVFLQQCHYV